MDTFLARGHALRDIYRTLAELVEDMGVTQASTEVGVSSDTMRRRLRGSQPWQFEEVLDLARAELRRGHVSGVSKSIAAALSPQVDQKAHPLLLPSNLRHVLRLTGRLTTQIADTLDDGRVDPDEARRLLKLFGELDQLVAVLRIDLGALINEG